MQRLHILLIAVLGTWIGQSRIYAQPNTSAPAITLTAAVFNASSLLPGAGNLLVTATPIHPGFNLGAEFLWREGGHHRWIQTAKLGYFYHRYSQYAVQLYTEFGYRRHFGGTQQFALEARLGGGYLHAISDLDQFETSVEGNYEKKHTLGRPQAMFGLALGPQYTFEITKGIPLRLYIDYQFFMQTPFVKKYVPMLPYTALHIGCGLPLNNLF